MPVSGVSAENAVVRVNMLGGFELHIGDSSLVEELNRSKNMWNLLSYIIVHRDRNIPQSEFIDILWPDEDCENPVGALKTLLYRTRSVLMPFSDGDSQLILSQRGSYSWNHEISCSLDAEEFQEICSQVNDKKLEPDEKLELYRKAFRLYRGDFLPRFSDQLWVVPISARYHSMYVSMVVDFAGLLAEMELFSEMADVTSTAIAIDPYDEHLYSLLIRALLAQGKDTAALNQYENATDTLYRNLGVRPSAELRDLYNEIMKVQNALETDLGAIQDSLRETLANTGAFVCEYGFFKEIYRLEARRAERAGTCIHIALITVSTPSGGIPALKLLNKTMDQLLEVLIQNLRRGDIISKYSGAQYVLMLPTANYEDGTMVLDRIVDSFYRQYRRSFLKLNCKLRQLDLFH